MFNINIPNTLVNDFYSTKLIFIHTLYDYFLYELSYASDSTQYLFSDRIKCSNLLNIHIIKQMIWKFHQMLPFVYMIYISAYLLLNIDTCFSSEPLIPSEIMHISIIIKTHTMLKYFMLLVWSVYHKVSEYQCERTIYSYAWMNLSWLSSLHIYLVSRFACLT